MSRPDTITRVTTMMSSSFVAFWVPRGGVWRLDSRPDLQLGLWPIVSQDDP